MIIGIVVALGIALVVRQRDLMQAGFYVLTQPAVEKLQADQARLDFVMTRLFILDAVEGTGCHRIYDTRGAIDEAMEKHG